MFLPRPKATPSATQPAPCRAPPRLAGHGRAAPRPRPSNKGAAPSTTGHHLNGPNTGRATHSAAPPRPGHGPASHQPATVPEGRTVLANAPDRLGGQRNGERKHGDCPCETGPRSCTEGAGRKRHRRRPHLSRSKCRLSSTGPGRAWNAGAGPAGRGSQAPSCRPLPSRRSPPERCPLPAGPGRAPGPDRPVEPPPLPPPPLSTSSPLIGRSATNGERLQPAGFSPPRTRPVPKRRSLTGRCAAGRRGRARGPSRRWRPPRSWRPGRGPASAIAVPAFHGAPRGEGSPGARPGRAGRRGEGRGEGRFLPELAERAVRAGKSSIRLLVKRGWSSVGLSIRGLSGKPWIRFWTCSCSWPRSSTPTWRLLWSFLSPWRGSLSAESLFSSRAPAMA